MDRSDDDELHHAEVLRRADDLDSDLEQWIVKIGDKHKEVMMNDLRCHCAEGLVNDQLEREGPTNPMWIVSGSSRRYSIIVVTVVEPRSS